MIRKIIVVALMLSCLRSNAQVPDFTTYPEYKGTDLGLSYSARVSAFRLWAPSATRAELRLYAEPLGGTPLQVIAMTRAESGTWTASLSGDHAGKYYSFRVQVDGNWLAEVPDPYVKMAGVNGRRGFIGDLRRTDPEGWAKDKSPLLEYATDAVVYELHVRDASIHPGSGIVSKGKFKGLTETGTRNKEGLATGLDHMKELGVTHVHLLPSYDFFTVDETKPDKPQYNWGYDPLNYNVPEGSYSTDAGDPYKRLREFKELIMTFHGNGLRVVMDVVYNHTMLTEDSWFNQLVPKYYYRQDKNGGFSNATACNNETASERPMMRKFILESVLYWVREYHVDGFRFDLMGVHDIETMNLLARELRKVKPDILLYGEGWTAGASPLPDEARALKKNAALLDDIAVFSDDIRDGIKGSVFEHEDGGFASGKKGMEESVKFGVVAATAHPQVDISKVNYSKAFYAAKPSQVVTYCECHDNHVLWDKLKISAKGASEAELRNMHKLALGIVLTSQGISFLHAGTEFLRSKKGVENSFNSPDSINAIDWGLKSRNRDVHDYVKGLVQMRKKHPAFRMRTAEDIARNIRFIESSNNLIIYTINGAAVGDTWKEILVAFNGKATSAELKLPAGKWNTYVLDNSLSRTSKKSKLLAPYSAMILYKD